VLNWILLGGNVAVVAAVVAWRAWRGGGIVLGHVELFAFGFLYYWMLPALAALLDPPANDPAVIAWYALVRSVVPATFTVYLALCLAFLLAFVGGTVVASRVAAPPMGAVPRSLPFDPRLLAVLLVPCIAAAALLGYQLRDQFFASYSAIFDSEGPVRGPFLALGIVALSLALLHTAASPPRPRPLANRWVMFYILLGGAGVTLGGRMYFVTGLLTLAAYQSAFVRPLRPRTVLVLGTAGALFAGLVGALRFGFAVASVGVAPVAAILALEPVFTSFSLFDFLRAGRLEALNAPYSLASSFLNFVPSFVLPDKVAYIVTPEDLGYSVRAPLGAFSSFVSLMVNFGGFGACLVLALFGAFLERLRRRGTAYAAVAYSLICGFLAFSLFRDPFHTSVVKSVVQFALLTPALVIGVLHVLTVVGSAPVLAARGNGAARAGRAGD
jgi:hypothetical protein